MSLFFVFILHFIGTIMTTCSSSSIYSWDKADFRVPGPKRSQPYLTMCIPIVTFSFPDTYEHSKNQLSSFIHSFLRCSRLENPYDFKGHTYIWTYPPITIKVTFSFPEYVLACKKISLIHPFIQRLQSLAHF